MAKIRNPLFSMVVSGAFGDIIFDRRGYVRRKGGYRDRKSASQGNARQALTAAQRCAQACGPQTRKRLRAVADEASYWSAYLTKHILGSKRATFEERRALYNSHVPEPPTWEAEAVALGLAEVHLDYADEAPIAPGLQLFMLAATLYDLGIYTELGDPAAGEATAWRKAVET